MKNKNLKLKKDLVFIEDLVIAKFVVERGKLVVVLYGNILTK